VVAWATVLAALGFWAVRHDPPTVPEQRSIAQALPTLQRATGAVLAAAQGPGRVVVLNPVRLDAGCRITPVRSGVEGIRDVTVYVPAGRATTVLEAVARALPRAYRADVATKGARAGLHADAGSYVGIDADTLTDAQMFTLEASTGCRPPAAVGAASAEPEPGDPPAALTAVLHALDGSGEPAVTAVACPDGRTAAAYSVDRVPRTADLGRSLEPVISGAAVVRGDPDGWAYRTGTDSIVVTVLATGLRVTATTAC
jgi:hypothetical protein